jgi:hypothetical protein
MKDQFQKCSLGSEISDLIQQANHEFYNIHYSKAPNFQTFMNSFHETELSFVLKNWKISLFRFYWKFRLAGNAFGDKNLFVLLSEKSQNSIYFKFCSPMVQIFMPKAFAFFIDPQKYIQEFFDFFNDDSTKATLFSYFTFPSFCFYFSTNEFSKIGGHFVQTIIRFRPNSLSVLI